MLALSPVDPRNYPLIKLEGGNSFPLWRLFTGQTGHFSLMYKHCIDRQHFRRKWKWLFWQLVWFPFFVLYFSRRSGCSFGIKIMLCVCVVLYWYEDFHSQLLQSPVRGRFGVIISIYTGGDWHPYKSGILQGS